MEQSQHNQDDTALVAAVRGGDRDAFGPLLQRHYASLVRLCRRLLGPSIEAQDVAQEAALQAYLSLERLGEPARFGAWLHAIGANLARTAMRRRRALSLDLIGDEVPFQPAWSHGLPAPEQVATIREVHDTIVAALAELSAVNREVVIGFYLEGYSYDELATLLGVPVSTVKGRLFKGRSKLRQRLAPLAAEVISPARQPRTGAVRGTPPPPDRRALKGSAMPVPDLIDLSVHSIYSESWGHRVALLRHAGDPERVLPIWVDPLSAEAIQMAINGEKFARPMTHDLMLRLLGRLDTPLDHVRLSRVADDVFFAELVLGRGDQELRVDSRCSDAIALALRAQVPIRIERSVFDADSAPYIDFLGMHGYSPEEVEKVRRFSITVSSLAMSEIADLTEAVEDFELNGQPLVAVALPNRRKAVGFWGELPAEGEPMWLLLRPERWEQVSRRARLRRMMNDDGSPLEGGRP